MNLSDYQKNIMEKIYKWLIYTDDNMLISLSGDEGSGKTFIANSLINLLKEDWSVLFINGITPNLSPYLTWHIGTEIYEKKKLDLGATLTFGINSALIPVTMEVSGNFLYKGNNYILTPSEESILSGIIKMSSGYSNLLIIADNYNLWDIPSKKFLEKLLLPELKLLEDLKLAVLILTCDDLEFKSNITQHKIKISDIPDEDLLFILRQNFFSQRINLREIRACAGNNISLACMVAEYYKNVGQTTTNFNVIMEKRCKMLPESKQEVCKVLEPLSIIDTYFTRQETAFFLEPTAISSEEKNYIAEEYLEIAEEQAFITGEERYCFTNKKIRQYFKNHIAKKERLYHKKFATYLQINHPEDYYNRGRHLSLSLLKNEFNSIIESLQLLFLSYIRRASEIGNFEDIYNIKYDINRMIQMLKPELKDYQKDTLKNFFNGYKFFFKYDYKNTIICLQRIVPSRLCKVCLAETQRILLLCQIQLANNFLLQQKMADELYETINSPEFQEDEQYCRAALVLLDAYIDKSNVQEKTKTLKRKFIQLIQNHTGSLAFEEFEATYNRKSALYYTANIAKYQTQQSIEFYRDHYNKNGLYMALCNHAGNAIISGDYSTAKESLEECKNIVMAENTRYYPSFYKIENNIILLSYLKKEQELLMKFADITDIAKHGAEEFFGIINNQKDEVSYVVYLNYLSLLMLSGSSDIHKEIMQATVELVEIDEYYQYYLHDLKFAYEVIYSKNYEKAEEELQILINLDVPLLHEYRQIFLKRQMLQRKILNTLLSTINTPIEYHKLLLNGCEHTQDNSYKFYGRGFLLSDLQFLSF